MSKETKRIGNVSFPVFKKKKKSTSILEDASELLRVTG